MKEYTLDEINKLVFTYAEQDKLTFPGEFEHRLDVISSKILYSLIREVKPQVCMEFGTSWGGSALVILKALEANDKPYKYIGFEMIDDLKRDTTRNLLHWAIGKLPNKIDFELYGDITKNVDKIPKEIDFAFIDSDWDMGGVSKDGMGIAQWTFENVIPRVKKGGLVSIHDWSVTKDLVYEGGVYPGISYFIKLFKEGKMPLKKIFSDWDWEEYKVLNIALIFWEKT